MPRSVHVDPPPVRRSFTLSLVAAFAVVAFLLRFAQLDTRSLWLDEVVTLKVASKPLSVILSGRAFDNHTPPLYYALLHLLGTFLPLDLHRVRVLSAILDGWNVVVLGLGFSWAFGRRTGLMVAGFWTLAPFCIRFGQEARMYPLAVLLVSLAFLASRKAVERDASWRWLIVTGLAALGAFYTHYYAAFVLVSVLLVMLRTVGFWTREGRRVWVTALAAASLTLPWVPVISKLIASGGQSFRAFTFMALPYAVFRFLCGYSMMPLDYRMKEDPWAAVIANAPLIALALAVVGAMLLMAWRTGRRRQPADTVNLAILAFGTPVLALLCSLATPMLSERYLVLVLPFGVALLCQAPWGAGRPRWWLVVQAAGVLLFVSGFVLHLRVPDAGTTRWRTAAELIERSDGSRPTVLVHPRWYVPLLDRLLPEEARVSSQPPSDLRGDGRPEELWVVEVARFGRLPELRGYRLDSDRFVPGGNGLRVRRFLLQEQ